MNRSFVDRTLIYAASLLRSVSIGMIAVLLAIYLTKVGLTKMQIGLVVSLGLLGASLGTFLVTFVGDYLGRKRTLIIYALLTALGGIAVSTLENFYAILVAAFLGMVNSRGKDRGPALVLEAAILPSLESNQNRTKAFAWYYIFQDIGLGIGAIVAGLPTLLATYLNISEIYAFQLTFGVYSAIMVLSACLYWALSDRAEISVKRISVGLSTSGKKIAAKLSGLFALEGVAGGFLTSSLIAFYFYERFEVPVEALGLLFFTARCLNAGSHLVSAWIAKYFGLVNTMTITHAISHIFLVSVAFAPTFPLAVCFYLMRESLSKMEGPTKRSYIMAIVEPDERTKINGITQMVRMMGWAVAPLFAGYIMQEISLASPLFIGAGMKLSYDILMYLSFHKIKPPEETKPAPELVVSNAS